MNDSVRTSAQWSVSTLRDAARVGTPAGAATALARHGIPVFPCVPGDKQPLTKRGFHDASTDLDQVAEWWRRSPDANIGLPTGGPSGVVVVDVDVHTGGTGYPAFERARREDLVASWGWLVRTPSGGLHAYFRPSKDELRSWQVPSQHVDFRGDGGYVVVPPSRVSAEDGVLRRYEVIAVAQHHPRPLDADALRRFLEPPESRPRRNPVPELETRPDQLAAWVASRPEGARNDGLFWAACRMAERRHRYDTTLSILGEAARSSGLPEREIESTVRSAYRKVASGSPGRPLVGRTAHAAVGL